MCFRPEVLNVFVSGDLSQERQIYRHFLMNLMLVKNYIFTLNAIGIIEFY